MKQFLKIILLMWCTVLGAHAQQQAVKDLQAVSGQVKKQKLCYDISYLVYDQKQNNGKALEENKISCYLWYPYSIFKYPDVEFYHNEKMKVAVYAKSKKVIVNKADKAADKAMLNMEFTVDSLMKFYDKIELVHDDGKVRTYRITYHAAFEKYSHTDLSFDSKLFRLTKLSLYCRRSVREMFGTQHREDQQKVVPRIDIVFSNYRVLTEQDRKLFDARNVVQLKGGRVSLTPAYSGYTLSNYYKAQ